MTEQISIKRVIAWAAAVIGALFVAVLVIIAIWLLIATVSRAQARANANNAVAISSIEIRNQAQRVTVAQQQADIRYQNAIGVRRAQDEIAKTLTPLYVQFEMVQALQDIANSGKNNTVVYIPVGANGIPLVSNTPGSVGLPSSGGG